MVGGCLRLCSQSLNAHATPAYGMVADLDMISRPEQPEQKSGCPHDAKTCRTLLNTGVEETRETCCYLFLVQSELPSLARALLSSCPLFGPMGDTSVPWAPGLRRLQYLDALSEECKPWLC